jgi:hypothetical protein
MQRPAALVTAEDSTTPVSARKASQVAPALRPPNTGVNVKAVTPVVGLRLMAEEAAPVPALFDAVTEQPYVVSLMSGDTVIDGETLLLDTDCAPAVQVAV